MTKSISPKKPKLSAGKKVIASFRGSVVGTGKIIGTHERVNGAWVGVNLAAPRKTPNVRYFRPADLQLA